MSDAPTTSDTPTTSVDASVATFVSALIFNVVVSAALFLVFFIIRNKIPRLYSPKTYIGPERERATNSPRGFFGWITGCLHISDENMIKTSGLDAFMFLQFLKGGLLLFSFFTILGIPILIPVDTVDQLDLDGLNVTTISNVSSVSRLWAHLVLAIVFCAATLALTVKSMLTYIAKRQDYLLSDEHVRTVQASTILVCGIPAEDNNVAKLNDIFEVFPGGVRRIWLAYSAQELEKDTAKRVKLVNKLEGVECKLIRDKIKYEADPANQTRGAITNSNINTVGESTDQLNQAYVQDSPLQHGPDDSTFPASKRPKHNPGTFPASLFGSSENKLDSITTYRSELSNMNASILAKQQAGIQGMHDNTSHHRLAAAFIQFNSQVAAHLAVQSVIHKRVLTMNPRFVEVHPQDVIWDNLAFSLRKRAMRKAVAMVLTIALIVLWAIPVAFVASVANLDTLVSYAPFLSGIYNLPTFVVGIIEGLLPPVGLAILMMILPIILYRLARFGGAVLHTGEILTVQTWYHWFSVVHVLLVSTLANGIFPAIEAIKNNPSEIMNMLAQTLPEAATFFMTYILLNLVTVPLLLINIGALIGYVISHMMAKTPRQIYASETGMGSVNWGTVFPVHTIAFSIGILYSTIQPLILPMMVVYFGLYYLAYKYLFVFVYRQPLDTGGLTYPRAVDQVYVGVVIYQLTMLGLFILKKAVAQTIIMFIVLVVTLIAVVLVRRHVFASLVSYLPAYAFDNVDVPQQPTTTGSSTSGNNNNISSGGSSNRLDPGVDIEAGRVGTGTSLKSSNSRRAAPPPIRIQTFTDSPDNVNPIPHQGSFHEKAPYKDPTSPLLPSMSEKELFSPKSPKRTSSVISGSSIPSIRVENVGEGVSKGQENTAPTTAMTPTAPENPYWTAETVDRTDTLGTQATSTANPLTVEKPTMHPRTTTTATTSGNMSLAPSRGNLQTDSEMASLQVLGAAHSLFSSDSIRNPGEEKMAPEELLYVNPALWRTCQPIWLPKDPRGFAEIECLELNNAGLANTTESANMNERGRISVEVSHRVAAPGEVLFD